MKKIITNLCLTTLIFIFSVGIVKAVPCGTEVSNPNTSCECDTGIVTMNSPGHYCCGVESSPGVCSVPNSTLPPGEAPTAKPTKEVEEEFQIEVPEVNADTLNKFNPMAQYSNKTAQLSTPGGILTTVLDFAFPIAGIILFLMILFGGFKMLTGATNESTLKEGQQMIVSAVVGFIILFAAYWIATLMEMIFGISILS